MARQLTALWENSRLLLDNRELTGRMRHQAFHDHLTGLANRTLFTERVSEALAGSRVDGSAVAVLFIDLDDFKIVNDSLGHQIGDELLISVAQRLRSGVPQAELLGRLGGDEFAVLVHGAAAELAEPGTGSWYAGRPAPTAPPVPGHGVEAVAGRVIEVLSTPMRLSDMRISVRASVGIAASTGGGLDTAALLRNADVAMYAAKHAGKGGWCVFRPGMLLALLSRHRMQAALAEAVTRDEFVVHYQPIVRLADGAVHGAEALVRWRRPDGRLMPPGQFIPLAEETGLVGQIDRLVLRRACEQAARWGAELPGGDTFSLHVNLSARELHRRDLVTDVARTLDDSGLPAERLTLEITESGLGQDHDGAIDRLRELTRLGVHLAIDDFGTGYSSLAYLRRMPVDVLKIDKAFTAELNGDGVTPLAQAIIALAAALHLDTVAEGVEDSDQAARLLALGCGYGQGFHYAAPLPAEEIAALVGGVAAPG
jgi:predicted signal transduction protein with EAL and GGDEF domain